MEGRCTCSYETVPGSGLSKQCDVFLLDVPYCEDLRLDQHCQGNIIDLLEIEDHISSGCNDEINKLLDLSHFCLMELHELIWICDLDLSVLQVIGNQKDVVAVG